MEWIQGKIITTTENIELLTSLLIESGVEGMQIEDEADFQNFLTSKSNWDYIEEDLVKKERKDTVFTFYLTKNETGENILKATADNIEVYKQNFGLTKADLFSRVVKDDWSEKWKQYYKPFKVGENVIIKPLWENYDKKNNEVVFNINPGHVFGTGMHHTTKLCIEQLEKVNVENENVLDLGCGSGILSVISLLLGAKSALAIDIDKNAEDVAFENAEHNGVKEKYEVLTGDVTNDETLVKKIKEKKYKIIVANIVADVIIGLKNIVNEIIEEDTIFITSGIIDERKDEVISTYEKLGFTAINVEEKEGWVCINFAKRGC